MDEDEPADLSNPCGKSHGLKLCGECIDLLAQSAQLTGKRRSISSTKTDATSQKPQPKKRYSIKSSVNYSDYLVLSKKNVEACFVEDFSNKLLSYKPKTHNEYEGLYKFTVVVGMVDSVLSLKSTLTKLEIDCIAESDHKDEDYTPFPEPFKQVTSSQTHSAIPQANSASPQGTRKRPIAKALTVVKDTDTTANIQLNMLIYLVRLR